VAVIVFGVVVIFVNIPGDLLVYSVLGLVIFAGFTMFDLQRLRRSTDINAAPLLAASNFVDVLNVFLFSWPSSPEEKRGDRPKQHQHGHGLTYRVHTEGWFTPADTGCSPSLAHSLSSRNNPGKVKAHVPRN
jgi:hypothetical protein